MKRKADVIVCLVLLSFCLPLAWAAKNMEDGSSENYYYIGNISLTMPLTLAAWCNVDTANAATSSQYFLSVGDVSSTDYMGIGYLGPSGAQPALAGYYDGTGTVSAQSTANMSYDTWHHVVGIFTSSSSRTVYLDGGNSNTESTAKAAVTPLDRISIGCSADSTPYGYIDGRVAECAIWDAALDASEIAALADGISPESIRPGNLEFYAPLIRDDIAWWSGMDGSPNGTPDVYDHPRSFK